MDPDNQGPKLPKIPKSRGELGTINVTLHSKIQTVYKWAGAKTRGTVGYSIQFPNQSEEYNKSRDNNLYHEGIGGIGRIMGAGIEMQVVIHA